MSTDEKEEDDVSLVFRESPATRKTATEVAYNSGMSI